MASVHPGTHRRPSGLGHADVCPALLRVDPHDCPTCGRQAPD